MRNVVLFLMLSVLIFTSCNEESRILSKFESRFNAKEYSLASTYIYSADHPSFSFFLNEVKDNSPNLLIKSKSTKKAFVNGALAIVADFQLINSSKRDQNFFRSIGYKLSDNYVFSDTIYVKETSEGKKLSFNWGLKRVDENDYLLAHISGDGSVERLNIRRSPSTQSKIIGKLEKGNDVIITNVGIEKGWEHCYKVNSEGDIYEGYVYNNQLGKKTSSFFALGIFESVSLTVAVIIIAVICVILAAGSFISSLLLNGAPMLGFIILAASILGLIYTAYQMLEKIIFELFIINLPY